MSIDEIEAQLAAQTWQERVEAMRQPTRVNLNTQYRGNRVISHFYPEHWAKVQIARWTQQRYGVPSGA